MTVILALETSSTQATLALNIDGSIIQVDISTEQRSHSHQLLPVLDALLNENNLELKDLTALAWSAGPGSFTGLRLSASTIQALAFALDLPVLNISTLHALAAQVAEGKIATLVDARQNEFYFAEYDYEQDMDGVIQTQPQVLPLADIALVQANDTVIGNIPLGLRTELPMPLQGVRFIDALPQAREIASLAAKAYAKGLAVSANEVVPHYIRNKVVN